jgi:4-amino-4-deoxy-L-arabinose transferase-like glycosyltransferase
MTPDAVWYMRSAHLLANGWHMAQLPTQWPPGFAIVLAFAEFVVGDFLTAARILQAVIGAANVLLFCRLLERSGLSRAFASLTTLLLMVQPAFLDVHLMLWSEPLFLSLVLLDLLLLQSMLDASAKPSRQGWLGLVCGAAIMLRYAGLFLVPVNAAAVLLFSGHDLGRRRRIWSALATAGLSLLPLLGWLLFNHSRGQSATNRTLAWHPADTSQLGQLLHTAASWAHVPDYLGSLVVLAIAAALAIGLWAMRRGRSKPLLASASFSLCVLAYAAFLWLAISLADYYTPLDERILSPVFPVFLAVLAILARQALDRFRGLAFPLVAMLIWLLAFGGHASWQNWHRSRVEGVSFSSRYFRELPALAWLRGLPMQARILSNGPEILEIYLKRDAKMLPRKLDPGSRIFRQDYPQSLANALSGADTVVYFSSMAQRSYLASPGEIDRASEFRKVYDGRDAIVWIKTSAGSPPRDDRP